MFVPLATPSLRRTWERICRNVAFEDRNRRGIVHGLVVDGSGRPVGGALVQFNWHVIPRPTGPSGSATVRADLRPMRIEVISDPSGRYSACGFVEGATGTIAASRGQGLSELTRFSISDSHLVRVDLRAD